MYTSVSPKVAVALLASLIAVLGLPSATVLAEDPSTTEPAQSRLASPEIFGYLTYWDLDAAIDYEAITTIAYFSLVAGADGRLVRTYANGSKTTAYSRWLSSRVTSVIDRAHAHGVKVVLTVDRMAWDDAGRAATRALLGSATARTTLVRDIVREVVARGVDGVTLDFEPILSDTRDQFAALLAELRAALDAVNPAYQLTFATTGSAPALTYQMFGNVTAAGWADAVLIMAYPLRGLEATVAGGLAPLYSPTSYDLKQISSAYLQYVAADKIVMLLPWYGRQWPTVSAGLNSRTQTDSTLYGRASNMGYDVALPYAIAHGRNLDPVEQSAWTVFRWRYCSTCPETWKQIYYDDVETLGFKYDYVLQDRKMAGIGIWALGYDNERPELWKLLRTKYGGLVDVVAPTGTVALAQDDTACEPASVRLGLTADDGADGSGAVYVRISNSEVTGDDGLLTLSRTYPAAREVGWSLTDPALGGGGANDPRTVYAQWRDVAGNWSSVVAATLPIARPGGEATVKLASGAQFTATAMVDVLVEQTAGRAIARVIASNSGSTTNGVLSQAADITLGSPTRFSVVDPATGGSDTDGPHTVHLQWQDSAGCWSTPVSASVALDRTAPVGSLVLTDAPPVSASGEVLVASQADDEGSGVESVELSNDGSNWQSFEPSGDPIAWSAGQTPDGDWTIHARWSDGAGNVSAPQTVSLRLDRNGPSGQLRINSGASTTNVEDVLVETFASDATSEVTTVRLSNSADMADGVLRDGVDFDPGASVPWTLAGDEGVRTVYGQWQDAAGHWSSVESASILLDRSAPSVSAPRTSLARGTQLGLTSVPLAASWQATDALSGVANVSLETSRDATAWTSVPHAAATTTSALTIDRSATWRVRASARDVAGNTSLPVEGIPVRAVVTEDSSSDARYSGSWTAVRRSSASGGTIRYATRRGATATYRFTGRSIAWAAAVGPNLGRARVLVDGSVVTTVDLQAALTQQRRLVFAQNWATSGTHTITIRVRGTSGRPRVELDGFVVLK